MKQINLTKDMSTLVSEVDFESLNQFKWFAGISRGKYYAKRSAWNKILKKYENLYMHRAILNPSLGKHIDHIDGNTLNNTRDNLRYVDHSQNQMNQSANKNNSSGQKGVHFRNSHNRWVAKIKFNQIEYYLGEFEDIIEATQSYNIAAKKLFGEYANLNNVAEPSEDLINKINNKIDLKNSTIGYI